MIAPNISSTTYERLRRSSSGLGVARVNGAVCASGWPSCSTAVLSSGGDQELVEAAT